MTQKDQDAILGRLIKEHQETRALLSDLTLPRKSGRVDYLA